MDKIPIIINGFEAKFNIGEYVRLCHDPENTKYMVGKITIYSDGGYCYEIYRGESIYSAMPAELIGAD